jgi:3-oxoacyl-[acyl-carrier protein] reductase
MEKLRVLVTGGSRGFGRAIALRFAREGARVAVAARHSGHLDQVVQGDRGRRPERAGPSR